MASGRPSAIADQAWLDARQQLYDGPAVKTTRELAAYTGRNAATPLSITWIDLLLDCQKRAADAELCWQVHHGSEDSVAPFSGNRTAWSYAAHYMPRKSR